jgi:hypothetical protein
VHEIEPLELIRMGDRRNSWVVRPSLEVPSPYRELAGPRVLRHSHTKSSCSGRKRPRYCLQCLGDQHAQHSERKRQRAGAACPPQWASTFVPARSCAI